MTNLNKIISLARSILPGFTPDYVSEIAPVAMVKELYDRMLMDNLLSLSDSGVNDGRVADRNVTVSLTSFGERINWVDVVIESLMEQTVKANRIVLWLDRRHSGGSSLPASFGKLGKRGLEIRFCTDVGPATKLIPSLREFPDDIIITVDDDQLYDYDLFDRLLTAHRIHPEAICADWFQGVVIESSGIPVCDYKTSWGPDDGLMTAPVPLGVGGVLYPPGCLDERVFDIETMQRLAPKADDLWFKTMGLLKGTPVFASRHGDVTKNEIFSHECYPIELALRHTNLSGGQNDVQLKRLFDHFDLYRYYRL